MTVVDLARVSALLLTGLATGGLVVNGVGLGRAMTLMTTASAYVELHQATNRTFDPYMPVVVVGAAVCDLAVALLSTSAVERALLGGAAVGYAAVLVLSLLTNVRLNTQIAAWSVAHPPAHWSEVRRRWVRFHVLRTVVAVVALGATVLGVTA